MRKKKEEIITFKVDTALADAIQELPNRSEFIRASILAALDNSCPFCSGVGRLTPKQKEHWQEFLGSHKVTRCRDCHENVLVCQEKANDSSRK